MLMTDRKFHTRFRLAPKWTTLDDLQRPLRTVYVRFQSPTTKMWIKIDPYHESSKYVPPSSAEVTTTTVTTILITSLSDHKKQQIWRCDDIPMMQRKTNGMGCGYFQIPLQTHSLTHRRHYQLGSAVTAEGVGKWGRGPPPLPPSPLLSHLPSHFLPLLPSPPLPLSCPPLPLEVGPLNPARRPGERRELPQRGLGRSPSWNWIWCILATTTLAITAVFLEYLRQFLTDLNQIYRHSSVPKTRLYEIFELLSSSSFRGRRRRDFFCHGMSVTV